MQLFLHTWTNEFITLKFLIATKHNLMVHLRSTFTKINLTRSVAWHFSHTKINIESLTMGCVWYIGPFLQPKAGRCTWEHELISNGLCWIKRASQSHASLPKLQLKPNSQCIAGQAKWEEKLVCPFRFAYLLNAIRAYPPFKSPAILIDE